MPFPEVSKTALKGWLNLRYIIASGEAAIMCGYTQGRTFLKWAKRKGFEPWAFWGKKAFFLRGDVEKLAEILKKEKLKKTAI